LSVATTDPANLKILDQLQQLCSCRIEPVQATEQDIMHGIDLHYGDGTYAAAPTDLLQRLGGNEAPLPSEPAPRVEPRGASGMVENIMQRAISERASDIHIEPQQKKVYVRFRIDGVMYDHLTYDPTLHQQVISRSKILARLDIAQTRLPQDGRFDAGFGDREFDVRISVIPSINGERLVLRLLPKGQLATDFTRLGLERRNAEILHELINKPYGMVLATGPSGSGKTTSLYACLAQIDSTRKNVVTVEDPVECQLPRIIQIQVQQKSGMTFATGLRSILRQDPDIIMVGEIRDLETLQIAMQSALTGHLVLSTLHCNDAAGGAARMVDMGAEPFLVASSLNGIVAQRLVRRICDHCKTEALVSDAICEKLHLPGDGAVYYHGKGCKQCRETGYAGRIGVYEVLPVNEQIQQAILHQAPASEIRALAHACGYRNLLDDGIAKARSGQTSLEEVMRAVYIGVI
jgi:type IV pilus assembly protein PilB